jgi:hypothetical protein
MAKLASNRSFASLNENRQKEIARKSGRSHSTDGFQYNRRQANRSWIKQWHDEPLEWAE